MAKSYGIWLVPKNYLLDSEGCIVAKDLNSAKLRASLNERFEILDDAKRTDTEQVYRQGIEVSAP